MGGQTETKVLTGGGGAEPKKQGVLCDLNEIAVTGEDRNTHKYSKGKKYLTGYSKALRAGKERLVPATESKRKTGAGNHRGELRVRRSKKRRESSMGRLLRGEQTDSGTNGGIKKDHLENAELPREQKQPGTIR